MQTGHVVMVAAVFVGAISSCERADDRRAPQGIQWEEAVKLIRSGKAEYVSQGHSLRVSITTKDGRRYFTQEPEIDDVLRVIREVDPERKKITFMTE